MFRNSFAFLLGANLDDDAKKKVQEFKKKQEEFIDEMRSLENKMRDHEFNLYKQAQDIATIQTAEEYKFYVSNILDNMVNTVSMKRLGLLPRSILKLYSNGCRYCKEFVTPLSSIAGLFPPGALTTMEFNLASMDPYLMSVLDDLTESGWEGGVPAWFIMEPSLTGGIRYIPFSVPSWSRLLDESKNIDVARMKLANLLKEQLVADEIAKNISEIRAEKYIGKAKNALLEAKNREESVSETRKSLKRMMDAKDSDPIISSLVNSLSKLEVGDSRRRRLIDFDDRALTVAMMDPRLRIPSMSSLFRDDIASYAWFLGEKAKSATSPSTSSTPSTGASASASTTTSV